MSDDDDREPKLILRLLGAGKELNAEANAGSGVELSTEDVESLGALSDEARAMFRQLHKQVADEEHGGGPRTRFSILKNFLNMTTEELEMCIALYYRSQVSPSDVSAAAEPQEQNVVFDGSPLGSHGYPLRPNAETCAVYEKCGKCEYGEECRYNHPEEILAEVAAAKLQATIPPPPPPDQEEEALIDDDAESQAEETPPPTENGGADSQAVYCEDCEMWLNGPTQWEDHKIGKKHTKNLKRTARAKAATNEKQPAKAKAQPEEIVAPTARSEPLADMQPHGYTHMLEQTPPFASQAETAWQAAPWQQIAWQPAEWWQGGAWAWQQGQGMAGGSSYGHAWNVERRSW